LLERYSARCLPTKPSAPVINTFKMVSPPISTIDIKACLVYPVPTDVQCWMIQ
jgi:hypothetical protein